MNNVGEAAKVGRLMIDYAAAKKRLESLHAEACRIGAELIQLGRVLCDSPERLQAGQALSLPALEYSIRFPEAEVLSSDRIRDLVMQIFRTRQEVERMSEEVRARGLPL